MKHVLMTTLLVFLLAANGLFADVKQVSETKMEFKGTLGMIMRIAGGNKPIKSIDYYKGNLKRTDQFDDKGNLESSTIVDLDNEMFVNVDHESESFTRMSFAEWREMLESQMEGLEDAEADADNESAGEEDSVEVDWTFDVNVERTGEKQEISGMDAKKVILDLNLKAEVRDKESQQKQGEGEFMVTSTQWMTTEAKGKEEIESFNRRFAEKLGMQFSEASMANMINMIMQSNEELAAGMKKLQKESAKLEGFALETHSVYKTRSDKVAEAKEQEEPKEETPKSVGGLFGGFGKKLAKKVKADDTGDKVLMETTTKIVEYSTDPLNSDLFAAPANYEEKSQ